jgi:hypothetical protein
MQVGTTRVQLPLPNRTTNIVVELATSVITKMANASQSLGSITHTLAECPDGSTPSLSAGPLGSLEVMPSFAGLHQVRGCAVEPERERGEAAGAGEGVLAREQAQLAGAQPALPR